MLQQKVTKGFVNKHPALLTVPCSRPIYRMAVTGSVLHKKEIQTCYVLTNVGCQNPQLTQGSELLRLHLHKFRAIKQLFPVDHEAGIAGHFKNW
jgi:hypothetical protein